MKVSSEITCLILYPCIGFATFLTVYKSPSRVFIK